MPQVEFAVGTAANTVKIRYSGENIKGGLWLISIWPLLMVAELAFTEETPGLLTQDQTEVSL